jgi:hypothetical protein
MKVLVDIDNDPVTGSGSIENPDPNVAALATCNKSGGKVSVVSNPHGGVTVTCGK